MQRGIRSKWKCKKNVYKKLVQKEQLIASIQSSEVKVIVTIGAGDLGEMVPSIKKALDETF